MICMTKPPRGIKTGATANTERGGVICMLTALIRTIILYFLIMAGLRLMGKRQIGELEPSELVLALLISDLAAVPMQDFGIPLINGVLPILTLLSLSMIISVLNLKSIRFRDLICGSPTVIIQEGHVLQNEMRRTRFTVDELIEELRQQGVVDLATVQYAILETNGKLSVLLYPDYQPLTPKSAQNHKVDDTGLPTVLISDGRLLERNLHRLHLDHTWLQRRLEENNIPSIQSLFLLTVDKQHQLYFLKKE